MHLLFAKRCTEDYSQRANSIIQMLPLYLHLSIPDVTSRSVHQWSMCVHLLLSPWSSLVSFTRQSPHFAISVAPIGGQYHWRFKREWKRVPSGFRSVSRAIPSRTPSSRHNTSFSYMQISVDNTTYMFFFFLKLMRSLKDWLRDHNKNRLERRPARQKTSFSDKVFHGPISDHSVTWVSSTSLSPPDRLTTQTRTHADVTLVNLNGFYMILKVEFL